MAEVKKFIVFGSTGNTGIAILKRAIEEKLEVTAYVRTPSRVLQKLHKDIKIIEGDVLDKEKVENAMQGQDAVLSALGTEWNVGETTVISEGCKNMISGMKRHGIKKIAVVSVAFLFPGRRPFFFLKKVTDDHRRQMEVLKAESRSIDWIAMMAHRIRNSSTINPGYLIGTVDATPGRDEVTAAELADFIVKVVNDEENFNLHYHKYTGISSKPKKTGWFS